MEEQDDLPHDLPDDLLDEAHRRRDEGDLNEAAPLYERILRLDPSHAEALLHLGKLELSRANATAGADLLRRAAQRSPDAADVQLNLGIACKRLQQWGDAAQAFQRALTLDPNSASAYFELGDLSQTLGRVGSAVDFYLRTINLDAGHFEAFRRLGELLYAQNNWVGAENCFARIVDSGALNGDLDALLGLMSKLGISLIKQEKFAAAALVFQRILTIAPAIAEMHSNLAYIYERQGRLDEAVAAGLRAVELKPEYPEGHNNLGIAYRATHRLEDARRCFERAIALKPDFPLAQFNLGAVELMSGNFAAGWRGYGWRNLTLPQAPRVVAARRWDGQPIPGQVLLVHSEQGYGDTILFARFLQQAKQQSQAKIVLEGPAALIPLLGTIAGPDQVIQAGADLPRADFEIPLPGLPGVLGIEIQHLPGSVPYLRAPHSASSAWRQHLSASSINIAAGQAPLRVGIVWTGNAAQELNSNRSCTLAHFGRLATIPGIAWYSLQKEATEQVVEADWPAGPTAIAALGPMLNDFGDTAGALNALDLVISVDTAVAHLAGALGRPVWTILSHTPDWRWQLDRPDSAWYPTMRLFRQPRWGDWDVVFNEVAAALRELRSRS